MEEEIRLEPIAGIHFTAWDSTEVMLDGRG
jgi:hypothetical protein